MKFYFSYWGSKKREINEIIQYIPISLIDTIIEPFGGSCYISCFLYDKYPTKKYICSDLNYNLVYYCNNFYKNKDIILNECKNIIQTIDNDIKKYKEQFNNMTNFKIDDNNMHKYLCYNTYYTIRQGLFPLNNRHPKYDNYNELTIKYDTFFKNNQYIHQDYKILMEKYKNDDKCLIILDPPYLLTMISQYKIKNDTDEMWQYIYNFFNDCKCKIMLIINDNIFMRLLFKDHIKSSHNINMLSHKNRTRKHLIIANY
jgi:hypothetical protein